MEIPIHHLDAFVTDGVFTGNPAAVCPLREWLPERVMQQIATENNLSETAFFVGGDGVYRIRWMTPLAEIDLCGHATLASAQVVFTRLEPGRRDVRFDSMSGPLFVHAESEVLFLDFPSRPPEPVAMDPAVAKALGRPFAELLSARDYVAVYERADDVRALTPDMRLLSALDKKAVIATAPGDGGGIDFVSRFFGPGYGIDEDPVTGSSHTHLIPYWARRLGKAKLRARQVSPRGGDLMCEERGLRVSIGGRVASYLEGVIRI
jgi:PhzF family phenazine biosynthesis protein